MSARPTLSRAVVNSDGSEDGSRNRHSTDHGDAATDANSSRDAGSALRIPPTAPNTNVGKQTSAVTKRTGGSPAPSHRTTELMYAANGVTMIRISTGCAARSTNGNAARTAPTATANTNAIRKPVTAWSAVVPDAR